MLFVFAVKSHRPPCDLQKALAIITNTFPTLPLRLMPLNLTVI